MFSHPNPLRTRSLKETLRRSLRREEFPYCCGIEVLCNFEEVPIARLKGNEEEITSIISSFEFGIEGDDFDQCENPGMALIAINEDQKKVLLKSIKDSGFRELMKGFNEKSGHNVYLYGKILNRVRGVK